MISGDHHWGDALTTRCPAHGLDTEKGLLSVFRPLSDGSITVTDAGVAANNGEW